MYETSLKRETVVRLPLAGVYNTRTVDNTSVDSTAGGIVGVGIVGIMVVGALTVNVKDQRYINCFPEKIKNELTGNETFYLTKRPGWEVLNTPATGQVGTAVRVWASQGTGTKVISAFGSTNSTIYDDAVSKGVITGKAYFIEETIVGSTANILIASSDSTGWYLADGGALTQITDVDYPGNAGLTTTGPHVAMDGYIFIMETTGKIYNSDLNSQTSWTSTGYLVAQAYPDGGVGLARHKNYLVALGKQTVEFFENAGNPVGSPLKRLDGQIVKIGCIGQFAYTTIDDSLFWVSNSQAGGVGVFTLEGFQPKKISTPGIEILLNVLSTSTNTYMTCGRLGGKTWVVIIVLGNTFVYCIEDDAWHEWSSNSGPLWHRISGGSASTRILYAVSLTDTGGKVFILNPSSLAYQDNGSNYTMTVQTSKFDASNTYRKFLPRLELVGDQSASSNTLTVSWSDDDYQTWSAGRVVDLSDSQAYLTGCGSFKRRAFRLQNSSNLPLRLEALELHVKQGIH